MVGVLDAMPEPNESDQLQLLASKSLNQMGEMLGTLAPSARKALGRPDHAYGFTPLVIFRDVSRNGLT